MTDKERPSKFASVLRTRSAPVPEAQAEAPQEATDIPPVSPQTRRDEQAQDSVASGNQRAASQASAQQDSTDSLRSVDARTVGRPRTGKRSNNDYILVGVYIKEETRDDAEALLREDRRKKRRSRKAHPGEQSQQQSRRDFSDLVEELVAAWVQQQQEKSLS